MQENKVDYFKKFRRNLQLFRIAGGYSVTEFADKIGTKQHRIHDLEYGKHGKGVPKADELFKIATAFGVTPEDIVFKDADVVLS